MKMKTKIMRKKKKEKQKKKNNNNMMMMTNIMMKDYDEEGRENWEKEELD